MILVIIGQFQDELNYIKNSLDYTEEELNTYKESNEFKKNKRIIRRSENMTELQIENIKKIVYTFANKANITDTYALNGIINELLSMNINDSIDRILVSLNDLVIRKAITVQDVFDNVDMLVKLNPEKYQSAEDLIQRLNWIKGMNMEHPQMPLTQNHKLVIEAFDKFNELIQGKFDCYYTGGLMGYLATGHELERYHGDLDLFINEEQLIALKELVDSSSDFKFVSNMDHKEINGHEYKITYCDTPMSIGLFLFERKNDMSITTKEYYYENQDVNGELLVDEHHFSPEYTEMCFSNQVREHNGSTYKMMSLESIYNSKKNSRPKDRYDASIIKDKIDMLIDYKIDVGKRDNFDVIHMKVNNTIIQDIEQIIQQQEYVQRRI